MSRALLVEGRADLALDGTAVGTLVGDGDALALDAPGLFRAWRLFRGLGPSRTRSKRIEGLCALSRASNVRLEVRIRGRRVAHLDPEQGQPVRLAPLAVLRSAFPG